MTTATLTRTLDDELRALVRGDIDDCLVCGSRVDSQVGRVECGECGAILETATRGAE